MFEVRSLSARRVLEKCVAILTDFDDLVNQKAQRKAYNISRKLLRESEKKLFKYFGYLKALKIQCYPSNYH